MLPGRSFGCAALALALVGCGGDGSSSMQDLAVPPGSDLAVPPGSDLAVPPGSDLAVPPGSDLATPPGSDLTMLASDLAMGANNVGATIRLVKTQNNPQTVLCKDAGVTAIDVTMTDQADTSKKLTTRLTCIMDKFWGEGAVATPTKSGPWTAKAVTVGTVTASVEYKDRMEGVGLSFAINLCDPPNGMQAYCK